MKTKQKPEMSAIISAVGAGACVLLFIGLAIFAYVKYGNQLLVMVSQPEVFRKWLSGYEGLGAVVFVAIRALQTVVKIIPAEPLEIAAGYIYGTWGGLGLCMLGSLIGSIVILALTHTFGVQIIKAFVPQRTLDKFDYLTREEKTLTWLFFIFLIPSTPKDVLTYIVGLTKIKKFRFMALTSIARIPSIVTSTLCGAQLGEENYLLAAVIFIATFVLGVAGTVVYTKLEKKKTAAREIVAQKLPQKSLATVKINPVTTPKKPV